MRKVARVLFLSSVLLPATGGAGVAQGLPPWVDGLFGRPFDNGPRRDYGPRPDYAPRPDYGPRPDYAPRPDYEPRWGMPDERRVPRSWRDQREAEDGDVREGGARPAIAAVAPPVISFTHDFPANSIVIDTGGRKLYYVLADKRAFEYAIGVGREGFNWTGTEAISRKQDWPDWYPPAEMRERDPRLPEKMTGGMKNPLGAMALYLGKTLYRIHGTNDAKSIGRAESSGCFRMLNSAVMHLASITEVGTPVAVVKGLPKQPEVSRAPDAARPPPSADRATPPPSAVASEPPPVAPPPFQRYPPDYILQRR